MAIAIPEDLIGGADLADLLGLTRDRINVLVRDGVRGGSRAILAPRRRLRLLRSPGHLNLPRPPAAFGIH